MEPSPEALQHRIRRGLADGGARPAFDLSPDRMSRQVARMHRLVMSRTPRRLPRDYVVVPDEGRPLFDGTTVPILMSRFDERPSGLFVPASTRPQPLDLLDVFVTAEQVLGFTVPAPLVGLLLGQRSLSQVLTFCASCMAALERGDDPAAVDRQFVEATFANEALVRARAHLAAGHRILFPQVLLAMTKIALLVSPQQHPTDEPVDHEPIVVAMLGLAQWLGDERRAGARKLDCEILTWRVKCQAVNFSLLA